MADRDDDELRVLRERAYGPTPDIHLDPGALNRLRELERRGGPRGVPPVEERDDSRASLLDAGQDAGDPPDPGADATADADAIATQTTPRPGRLRHLLRLRPRRSTVLITLGVALFTVAAVVTLTVVQRVQTDPLQVGAIQVARLGSDPSFDAPVALNGGSPTEAYHDFHGIRAVVVEVNSTGYVGSSTAQPGTKCMVIYQPDLLTATDEGGYSYSGQLFVTACAAGAFPAAAAFTITDTAPESLRYAFAPDTALQFVYDESNDEVVVFKG